MIDAQVLTGANKDDISLEITRWLNKGYKVDSFVATSHYSLVYYSALMVKDAPVETLLDVTTSQPKADHLGVNQ